jgi:phospholipid/cholesterol/gamma-HCH transport system ATP-binding protein
MGDFVNGKIFKDSPDIIQLSNVGLALNRHYILNNVNLNIKKGETTVILGPSGAGKSTILRLILGLQKPDSGSIIINGIDIVKMSDRDLFPLRKKMAAVFQSNALFDSLTVAENVSYFLDEHHELSHKETMERVKECLSFVNLDGTEHLYPEELSGGMKKRVAIARAIAFNPEIILHDEPTTGLDPINSKIIIDLLKKIQESGTTSIVVTHIIKDAVEVGDSFIIIEDGSIVETGLIDSLRHVTGENQSEFLREIREEALLFTNLLKDNN